MAKVSILSKSEITSVLDMKSAVQAVGQAYAFKQSGKAELFPLVCHCFEEGEAELDIKSGTVDGAGIFGMKLVSAFKHNSEIGLPRLMGTILVFDRETGVLKSIMDGGHITNVRTGAAGAVGCQTLARPESETLLMVGTGVQGSNQIAAALEVMSNLKQILVYNPHSFEKAQRFCAELPDKLEKNYFSLYGEDAHGKLLRARANIPFIPVQDLQEACGQADIILTATPSRKALIMADWVKPGTHLSCVGSDMEGKQELEEALLAKARVFCDDRRQVIAVGECEKAVKQGLLKPEDICEIGDVLIGKMPGRQSADDITIFDSTGIGLQDLIVAALVTERAQENGLGVTVEI